jgi:hypothetical protein
MTVNQGKKSPGNTYRVSSIENNFSDSFPQGFNRLFIRTSKFPHIIRTIIQRLFQHEIIEGSISFIFLRFNWQHS